MIASDAAVLTRLPRLILWSTALLLLTGVAAFFAWWHTGNPFWIRAYFYYPGAMFFVACSLLETWLGYLCWRRFSPGDLLRPAWFLIVLSAAAQLIGGVLSHIIGGAMLPVGRLFGPISMALLGLGLFHVLRACRRNGVFGDLKAVDIVLLGTVVVYTVHFLFERAALPLTPGRIIEWATDPLLCILLLEAVLIRRSTANLGWGLISRCWISFMAAIFLTSVGDIGLWASARGYLPYGFEVASWYVWFVASASYALGPAYQLQAMLRASLPLDASGMLSDKVLIT